MSITGTYTKIIDPSGVEVIQLTPGDIPEPPPIVEPQPPIPMWDEYLWKRSVYMRYHGDPTQDIPFWEGAIWYYDGENSAYEQAEFTGNNQWALVADNCEQTYRSFLLNNGMTGWRVFPHGLYADYVKTGDELSKAGIIKLATKTPFAVHAYDETKFKEELKPFRRHRETVYLLSTFIICKKLGLTEVDNIDNKIQWCIDIMEDHYDQWFISKTAEYIQPFMLALGIQAMIEYIQKINPDYPLTWMKYIANWCWSNAWRDSNKAMVYWLDLPIEGEQPENGAPDLNMLIAPIYAYLYKQTIGEDGTGGDTILRERYDNLFVGAVEGAYLGNITYKPGNGGKQTSQFTRWSLKGAEWRLNTKLLGEDRIATWPADPPTIEHYESFGKAYKTKIRVITSKPCKVVSVNWIGDDMTTGTRPPLNPATLKHEIYFNKFRYDHIYKINVVFEDVDGNTVTLERDIDCHLNQ